MTKRLPLAVAVVIEHDGRFLLIRRGGPPFRGWWSPVTGKVEQGESLPEAAVREAHEEMHVRVEVDPAFFTCQTSDGSHELHFLRARWVDGTPRPEPAEVAGWGWFTYEQIFELEPIFEADLEAYRRVVAPAGRDGRRE